MPQNDQALLLRLKQSDLDFVVIGGVCCVFHSVPAASPFELTTLIPKAIKEKRAGENP